MHLTVMNTQDRVKDVITKYLSMNEIDFFETQGNDFFILSERYPNDIFLNCKNYLKLLDIKYYKNLFKVSPLLSNNYSKAEFKVLKDFYTKEN